MEEGDDRAVVALARLAHRLALGDVAGGPLQAVRLHAGGRHLGGALGRVGEGPLDLGEQVADALAVAALQQRRGLALRLPVLALLAQRSLLAGALWAPTVCWCIYSIAYFFTFVK